MEIDLVLAPVDGSDAAESAAEYAVAIAERYGADLHLLHVLEEQVMRGLDTGDVTAKSVADQHRAFAADVRETLPADMRLSMSSAAGFSSGRLSQTPGSVVLDSAEELDADFLVVPRQGPSADPDVTLGKASLYVLEYASQPVLSV
ncbi:MAG: universal stress protein UspA [Halobacteriales archaeon SW_9_67_25]|nr:MAG: universal stress protein UspA [Halobacteriales archaeon SW_9_67_25]